MSYRFVICCTLVLLLTLGTSCTTTRMPEEVPELLPFVHPLPDPLEGFNRSMHVFNREAHRWVLRPLGHGYDTLVPDAAEKGITRASNNLLYPVRLANNAMQGKWNQCWTETQRFAVNSTLGILGVRDAATPRGLTESHEDFAQTLAFYGVGPGCYIELPLLGPGTLRETAGRIADMPLDPVFYSGAIRPGISALRFLNLNSRTADVIGNFNDTNYDTYAFTKLLYFYQRHVLNEDTATPPRQENIDESFGFLKMRPQDPRFLRSTQTHRVSLNDSRMPYNCWPRNGAKGIMIILPGLGQHRSSIAVNALAELFTRDNWSVIALSNNMDPDFFLNYPENYPPGYVPDDSVRLARVIKRVCADFHTRNPGHSSEISVIGYSLGALNVVYLAHLESIGSPEALSEVRRYLAINPPIATFEAVRQIDKYYDICKTWPAAERAARVENIICRLAASLSTTPPSPPSLTMQESRYLVALNLRKTLAVSLLASQIKFNQGFLQGDPTAFNRNAIYPELMSFSYEDYFRHAILPFYHAKGYSDARIETETSLRHTEQTLRNNPKVTVFHNRNDFLLGTAGTDWFTTVMGPRAVIFPGGGHLGNMARPEYKQAILKAFP